MRRTEAEDRLRGTDGGSEAVTGAAAGRDGLDLSSDLHATAAYRRHVARLMVARALHESIARARAATMTDPMAQRRAGSSPAGSSSGNDWGAIT